MVHKVQGTNTRNPMASLTDLETRSKSGYHLPYVVPPLIPHLSFSPSEPSISYNSAVLFSLFRTPRRIMRQCDVGGGVVVIILA